MFKPIRSIDPSGLKRELTSKLTDIQKTIAFMESVISSAPAGTLRIVKNNNRIMYYHRNDSSKPNGTYLHSSDKDFVKLLAQSNYYQKLLHYFKSEEKRLSSFIKNIPDFKDPYDKLSPERQKLIKPYEDVLRTRAFTEFKNMNIRTQAFSPYDPEIYSNNNLRVHSKSERAIANALDEFNIPFIYAPEFNFEGQTIYSDFYAMNIHTFNLFAWEHLGMLGNEQYADRNIKKLKLYERNGFTLGKNLIITMESLNQPLNYSDIRRTIQNYLL